ncbi:MAG: hypothetical protein ACR2G0_02855 [Chthoniobacterales bacterium]
MSKKSLAFCLAGALLLAALPQLAWATPSGLNNIPTADTAPQGTLVLQTYSTVGGGARDDLNFGFKTGLEFKALRFEFGADSHVYPGLGGPVVVQAKVAYPLGEHLPTLAGGVANLAFTDHQRDRSGQPFGYGVLTEDFGFLRVTAGCGVQDGDKLPFVGLDKTFKLTRKKVVAVSEGKSVTTRETTVAGEGQGTGSGDPNSSLVTRDLFTLRADAVKQHNNDDWLYSAGVLVPICKYLVFETWGNFPNNGASPSVTLKADVVIPF